MNRKKIGVVIRSFSKKELVALKYLVLEQNLHQKSVEFEILRTPPSDPFLELLDSSEPQNRQELEREVGSFIERYKTWLNSDAEAYDLLHEPPAQIVLVSALKLSDYYYLTGSTEWTIIALGHWNRSMAPPSVVEFVLTLLADVAVEVACDALLPSHQGTKGCVSDFTASLDEARYKALTGYLCPACERILTEHGTPGLLKDTRTLLSRDWLGSVADPTTPSAIAKKLGYDLFQTKGFKPTAAEKAIEVLEQEWVKEALKLAGVVLAAAILVWLGLKSV